MKRYKLYMDNIKAPDTLHQRLRELEAPAKRPAAWKRYGSIAAAVVLVLGLGGFGYAYYYNTVVNPGQALLDRTQAYHLEDDPNFAVNFATEDPGETGQPGDKTLGGYEYHDPKHAGLGEVSFCILPYIDYGTSHESASQKISMDWAIQEGALELEMARDRIVDLLGGEDVVATHLDWDGYELTGWMWVRPDGTMPLCFVYGWAGPLDHFEFAVREGGLPPACVAYEDSVVQEIRGLTVTADKYDGEHGCNRRASFMKNGYGYCFDLTSTDAGQAELLVSRLVCCVAGERLALWTVDSNVETYTCPDCGQTVRTDGKHSHMAIGADKNDRISTAPYNPEAADPNDTAPPASGSDEPYVCTGYPVPKPREAEAPEFVPDYDPAYEDGVPDADPAESWEVCDGLPLAPEGWTRP